MTDELKRLDTLTPADVKPMPLKPFVERMLRENPEIPRAKVIRDAKWAVEMEYKTRKALLLS